MADKKQQGSFINTGKACRAARFSSVNKIDSLTEEKRAALQALPVLTNEPCCFLSAKFGQGYEKLQQALIAAANIPEIGASDVIVTNARHYEALLKAQEAILRVIDGLNNNISGEFVSQDIREAIYYLGLITGGSITNDEILGNIFHKFCIGK